MKSLKNIVFLCVGACLLTNVCLLYKKKINFTLLKNIYIVLTKQKSSLYKCSPPAAGPDGSCRGEKLNSQAQTFICLVINLSSSGKLSGGFLNERKKYKLI